MSDLLGRFLGDWNALLVLLIAGFLPNEIWRMLGLWLGGGVDEGSELLVWVRAVATAILAGVIAQIVVQPPGALASVPGGLRYGAVAAGFAVFMLTRLAVTLATQPLANRMRALAMSISPENTGVPMASMLTIAALASDCTRSMS